MMCIHFKAGKVPPDWKPKYDRDEYNRYDMREAIRKTQVHQRGQCCFNPIAVEVFTNHTCGHFTPLEHFVPSLQDFIWGDWTRRQLEDLREKVPKLTHQLKAARKISQNRLKRIQELTSKEPQPPKLKIVK